MFLYIKKNRAHTCMLGSLYPNDAPDYRLFRQDDEAAIMMRKRFVDELLRTLRVSENLSENKELVLEALEPLI